MQRFLFATESRYGPFAQEGRIVGYQQVDTLSLFHCERCGGNLLYVTEIDPPSGMSAEELDIFDPTEVAELDPTTFLEISILLWPTKEDKSEDKLTVNVLYRQEICPYCPRAARQRFLYAENEFPESYVERGKVVLVVRLETISLFRCEGCKAILVYKTISEDLEGPEVMDQKSPNWIIELNEDDFEKTSRLLCAVSHEIPSLLDPATPELVKKCHEIGITIRAFSSDLYALQLRKALEAVCYDLGASEYLPNGKRAMLWQQIDELGKQNVVGEFICKAADQLKDISNTGAHYSETNVTEVDIRKLEQLLALITTYVYGSRAETPASQSGKDYVH